MMNAGRIDLYNADSGAHITTVADSNVMAFGPTFADCGDSLIYFATDLSAFATRVADHEGFVFLPSSVHRYSFASHAAETLVDRGTLLYESAIVPGDKDTMLFLGSTSRAGDKALFGMSTSGGAVESLYEGVSAVAWAQLEGQEISCD
jgi:hypothetical protein